jgi:hypothetical protein
MAYFVQCDHCGLKMEQVTTLDLIGKRIENGASFGGAVVDIPEGWQGVVMAGWPTSDEHAKQLKAATLEEDLGAQDESTRAEPLVFNASGQAIAKLGAFGVACSETCRREMLDELKKQAEEDGVMVGDRNLQ